MFPHNLTCVPLDEVECDIRRIVVDFYSLDDVIVMFVTVWVPSSSCVLLTPVPTRFSLRVVDVALNRSFQQVGLRFTIEWKVGVLAVVTLEFNLVSRANSQFCSSCQNCEYVLADFFRMSLDDSNDTISQLPFSCSSHVRGDQGFDKRDVFHIANTIKVNNTKVKSLDELYPGSNVQAQTVKKVSAPFITVRVERTLDSSTKNKSVALVNV